MRVVLANAAGLDEAGIERLGAPVEPLVVAETCRVGDETSWVEASPPRFAGLSVEYELDYGAGAIGRQTLAIRVGPESYRTELAAARTFISLEEAGRLRSAGLALGVTFDELLVFDDRGPVGNTLRWPDECVRHKVLDLVGDLTLVGRPVHAHVRACQLRHEVATGLLFIDESGQDMHAMARTVAQPLAELPFAELCPGNAALQQLMERYR